MKILSAEPSHFAANRKPSSKSFQHLCYSLSPYFDTKIDLHINCFSVHQIPMTENMRVVAGGSTAWEFYSWMNLSQCKSQSDTLDARSIVIGSLGTLVKLSGSAL